MRVSLSPLALLLTAVLASGCVSSRSSPRGVIPQSSELAAYPMGAWIGLETRDRVAIQGELLAVDEESVHVLTTENEYLVLAKPFVYKARVEAYRNEGWKGTSAWAGVGAASTLTHGFFLVFTAPAWALGGMLTSIAESNRGFYDLRDAEVGWRDVAPYARFPAGMPEGLDTSRLRYVLGPGVGT
ncbi:hypothetical protein [Rubricoccus marinus]|uniref:Lipoprotein n=1 Tax=Rubricoccus marinus TaxID=716817 RepID=A0A259TWV3_9BACT|nr:hypothetical protein [Rubricoccus marinus]OZC02180.1 hypothetical protein BSZ36_03760 [Rubricoccus marinus]